MPSLSVQLLLHLITNKICSLELHIDVNLLVVEWKEGHILESIGQVILPNFLIQSSHYVAFTFYFSSSIFSVIN